MVYLTGRQCDKEFSYDGHIAILHGRIAESNIESQTFDNSIEISKGEGNGKLFVPILTVIAFVTIVGLSVYLINSYEEEKKKSIKFE